ncbi:hypothetical protein IRT45_13095 [Nocardia sp. BSTN01]|uniref:hypothetical protein n=1 Tax=Nocardia sp. BSTN01 TaxID=2783665 RepID=UPI00188F0B95|nr:hypothetical protein [Nocardia sp. BSTN01]MBF4998088.1 hypothetical protein [Nocardia sp. BSTN01]
MIRRQLGRQLEAPDPVALLQQAKDLGLENSTLRAELEQLRTEYAALSTTLTATSDDLLAARTSLRRMIRTRN